MLHETKLLLHKLKTEGIGSSVAGMHRGLDLLEQLVESDPKVAIKYFKGVAAACEHISGKFLGEGYIPPKRKVSTKQKDTSSINLEKRPVEEQQLPKDNLECMTFLLDGMKDHSTKRSTDGSILAEDPKASMTATAKAAESVL